MERSLFLLALLLTFYIVIISSLPSAEHSYEYDETILCNNKYLTKVKSTIKRCKSRTCYYANSCATFQIVLSGDIESNPGPVFRDGYKTLSLNDPKPIKSAPKCKLCDKGVGTNRKRLICIVCMGLTHISCSTMSQENQKKARSAHPIKWTCNTCLLSTLPFAKERDLDPSENLIIDESLSDFQDHHKEVLQSKSHLFKIMHLNTQSMISSFDEFSVLANNYPFDIITLSETWLNDNQHLIDYVKISGYEITYRNREKVGGGVGAYIREDIKFKVRDDLVNIVPEFDHLWIELEGKNKHSHVLIGIIYQSNFAIAQKKVWLDKFDRLLENVTSKWSSQIIITGDFNIDILKGQSDVTKIYLDLLQSHDLTQHVTKPTRKGKSLIDHIITNNSTKIQICDILPTPEISDHDAVYACFNARVTNFEPRYKYIRDNSKFDLNQYISDFSTLPFSLVYTFDEPDDMLDVFNNLIQTCIERHAPIKRCKFTRPPAPWIRDLEISKLKLDCRNARFAAHQTQSDDDWQTFRTIRNSLKSKIKTAKRLFYTTALSSKRPNEVWKFIHRLLNPSRKKINFDAEKLNKHYVTTAQRLLNSKTTSTSNIFDYVNNIAPS